MLETYIEKALKTLGVADQLIAAGGPTVTFLLAMLFGVAAAQSLKLLYKDDLAEPWFSRTTRIIAILASAVFAHYLSDSLNGGWEAAAGVSSIGFYHLSLKAIRKWAPWLELSPAVGSVNPPAIAEQAAAQRAADRNGENSGV